MQALEDKTPLLTLMQNELDKHHMREVMDLFSNAFMEEINTNGSTIVWDLIPLICQRLRGLSEYRFRTFSCCQQMLIQLCDTCNPKELLIIFLSELENDLNTSRNLKKDSDSTNQEGNENDSEDAFDDFEITDSNCFKALLKPFEIILLNLPKKRNETLKSVLSSLSEHVIRLSLNSIETYDFANNNRYQLGLFPEVKNVTTVMSMYVGFLETFVSEVDINRLSYNIYEDQEVCKTSDPEVQRTTLLKTLLRLLDYPLLNMDLSDLSQQSYEITEKLVMSSILDNNHLVQPRQIALKVVQLISCLHANFYTLLERTELIATNEEVSDIFLFKNNFRSAMAVICYMLASEPHRCPPVFRPHVYTHIHNLGVNLPYIRELLENNQYLVYDKGLALLASLLDPIKPASLEEKFFELLRQAPVDKSLISVMIYSSVKSSQEQALALFRKLIDCFEPKGRFKLIYSILSQPNQHAGVQGMVICLYKDLLFTDPIFQGINLLRTIRSIINIAVLHESNSDLLEKNDLLFSTLNFFRFVLIRDRKTSNETQIWDHVTYIRENFLDPLHKAIELCTAHYKLELCKLKEIKVSKKGVNKSRSKNKKSNKHEQTNGNPVIEFQVGGQSLPMPELSVEQEHQAILLALQNFDLLESLLVRVVELIDEQLNATT